NEVAADLQRLTVPMIPEAWLVAGDAMQADVLCLVNHAAKRRLVRGHQVLLNLGLAINGHAFARERLEIDAMATSLEGDRNTLVAEPLTLQSLADSSLDEEVDGPLLQQTGAHPGAEIVGCAFLQDDRFYACQPQEPRQQQARWSAANDSDLGVHGQVSPRVAAHGLGPSVALGKPDWAPAGPNFERAGEPATARKPLG